MKRSPSSSGEPGGPPQNVVAVIVEDLRAGTAGPVSPIAQKLSEVGMRMMRLSSDQAGDLLPEIEGLVVLGVVDGDQQPLGIDAEILGDQVPGKLDRPLLEIVAKGEIAEHFEERVMAGGVADIVEIIVLAAGAHAFLRRHGAVE